MELSGLSDPEWILILWSDSGVISVGWLHFHISCTSQEMGELPHLFLHCLAASCIHRTVETAQLASLHVLYVSLLQLRIWGIGWTCLVEEIILQNREIICWMSSGWTSKHVLIFWCNFKDVTRYCKCRGGGGGNGRLGVKLNLIRVLFSPLTSCVT